jgi:hypothetical protein
MCARATIQNKKGRDDAQPFKIKYFDQFHRATSALHPPRAQRATPAAENSVARFLNDFFRLQIFAVAVAVDQVRIAGREREQKRV